MDMENLGQFTIDEKAAWENNGQYAYRLLRENIMHRNLVPGQHINDADLTSLLRISRTPIREALSRLREERLVDIYSQNKTCVSYIDYQLIQEAMYIRSIIESNVLKDLCGNLTEVMAVKIKENLNIQNYYVQESTLRKRFFELDNQFHGFLYEAAGKSWTWYSLQKICTHLDRVRYLHLHEEGSAEGVKELYESHKALFDKIFKGEKDGIAEAVASHIRSRPSQIWYRSHEELTKYFVNFPDQP